MTHPEDLHSDREAVRAMLAGEVDRYSAGKRYVHRDGRIVQVRLSATLVRDERGAPLYFIAHTEDVTAAEAGERALHATRELLEFDYLKIDGEFVKALGANPTDPLVIRAVVDIARGLGAETIAEFVGGDDAVRQLRELGVDYGQGHHLSRPGPLSEILPALVVAADGAPER